MVFMVLGLPLHVGGWWITNLLSLAKTQEHFTGTCPMVPPEQFGGSRAQFRLWMEKIMSQLVDGLSRYHHIMIYRVCFMVNVMNYDYELLSSKLT